MCHLHVKNGMTLGQVELRKADVGFNCKHAIYITGFRGRGRVSLQLVQHCYPFNKIALKQENRELIPGLLASPEFSPPPN